MHIIIYIQYAYIRFFIHTLCNETQQLSVDIWAEHTKSNRSYKLKTSRAGELLLRTGFRKWNWNSFLFLANLYHLNSSTNY